MTAPEPIKKQRSVSRDFSRSAPASSRRCSFVKFLRSSASVDSNDESINRQLELLDTFDNQVGSPHIPHIKMTSPHVVAITTSTE